MNINKNKRKKELILLRQIDGWINKQKSGLDENQKLRPSKKNGYRSFLWYVMFYWLINTLRDCLYSILDNSRKNLTNQKC